MRTRFAAFVLLALTAGCSFGAGAAEPPVIAPGDRKPAPTVAGETVQGDPLALADLQGVVVVNFWASWCGPCATEAPHLQAIASEYADRGVHIVGVNVKDRRPNAMTFERDFGVEYPSWYDEGATIAASFGGIGPAALPTTIILDADHRVAARMFGAVDAATLAARLDAILAEEGA